MLPLQLDALAKLFTRAKAVGSLEDAYYVLAGLTALSIKGNLPKPVALELTPPVVPLNKVCCQPPSAPPALGIVAACSHCDS